MKSNQHFSLICGVLATSVRTLAPVINDIPAKGAVTLLARVRTGWPNS